MEPIKKSTLDFLKNLKNNNNRDWFIINKSVYNEARNNFETFIQIILNEVIEFEPIMKGLEVKSCVYRLNRDIRFSNDKTPYKSYFGAFIVRGGKKNGDKFSGYYIHVEPGNSMIAGGAYMPPAQWLSEIREKISHNGDELIKIINDKEFVRYFKEIEGEKLKTTPKGYPKDHPFIDLLRFKSFLVMKSISDKEICDTGSIDLIIRASKAMKPFNDFLNSF
jgi:uncharacterized protein (TIGR02453 family)